MTNHDWHLVIYLFDKKIKDLNLIAKVTHLDNVRYIYYDPKNIKGLDSITVQENEVIHPFPFIDLPNKQRASIFIAAPSGSGKSTKAKELISDLREKRKDKKRPVIVFTSNEIPDPAFESIENLVVFPFSDPEFLQVTFDILKDKIVLFDDWENISDKKFEKYVLYFIKGLLEQTRKIGVDVIVISHMIQQGLKTKPIIYECSDYYLSFASNKNACIKFLENYMNLDKNELKELARYRSVPFRFELFRKSIPLHSIVGNTIKLL